MNRISAIVSYIVTDLKSRKGLRQAWDEIDEDIKDEILRGWQHIVAEILHEDCKHNK